MHDDYSLGWIIDAVYIKERQYHSSLNRLAVYRNHELIVARAGNYQGRTCLVRLDVKQKREAFHSCIQEWLNVVEYLRDQNTAGGERSEQATSLLTGGLPAVFDMEPVYRRS